MRKLKEQQIASVCKKCYHYFGCQAKGIIQKYGCKNYVGFYDNHSKKTKEGC
jgi:hypothetical protein